MRTSKSPNDRVLSQVEYIFYRRGNFTFPERDEKGSLLVAHTSSAFKLMVSLHGVMIEGQNMGERVHGERAWGG